jgi:hypothetical protein
MSVVGGFRSPSYLALETVRREKLDFSVCKSTALQPARRDLRYSAHCFANHQLTLCSFLAFLAIVCASASRPTSDKKAA